MARMFFVASYMVGEGEGRSGPLGNILALLLPPNKLEIVRGWQQKLNRENRERGLTWEYDLGMALFLALEFGARSVPTYADYAAAKTARQPTEAELLEAILEDVKDRLVWARDHGGFEIIVPSVAGLPAPAPAATKEAPAPPPASKDGPVQPPRVTDDDLRQLLDDVDIE